MSLKCNIFISYLAAARPFLFQEFIHALMDNCAIITAAALGNSSISSWKKTCGHLDENSLHTQLSYLQFCHACLTYLVCSLTWFVILIKKICALLVFPQGYKYLPDIWSPVFFPTLIMAQMDQLFALMPPGFHPIFQ